MTSGSLRIRLLAAAALSILAALLLIGFLLVGVFDQHVRDRLQADLGYQLDQLAALSVPDAAAGLKIDGDMTDPRFDQPLGGLYWQVDRGSQVVARSRSLWDAALDVPSTSGAKGDGNVSVAEIAGPGGQRLLALSRAVTLGTKDGKPTDYRLTVANDLGELESGRRGLLSTLAAGLAVAFVGLLAASWLQVSFGLRPLDHIRQELKRIGEGDAARINPGRLPDEVRPLAVEVNRFLAAQEETAERARGRAGDLAHGLKTPLAAIAAEADRLDRAGERSAAEALSRHVESMRRHVERHLAVARSVGSRSTVGQAGTGPVGTKLRAITELLDKLPSERPLRWTIEGDTQALAAIDGEDFEEVFGNLLDNARKWARGRILVRVEEIDESVVITVADDGPGIAPEHLTAVRERGKRLDERVQGSGLGLSIVDAVLESYGADISMARSEALGGLEVTVRLARRLSTVAE